ncbi:putative alcohol dehydrogenase 1 [Glarea lozoyensis 74030]|uniref:Putative alcohol dehydrogenase 1 n=1 Tax=Glarea lozoyensis (strain ATCC 74030 / MF5533) TaxID=1104152 RepID=H0ERG0_GLAL7|nr:putative alcohol dehydrogenase 1 [Glarea lozoyensis 74030]
MSGFEFAVIKSSPSKEYVETTTTRPALTGDEVYIEITHSGVCGTDQHFRGVDMVLGHEGIGVIKAIGPDVKSLKVQNEPNTEVEETEQAGAGQQKSVVSANNA